MFLFQNVLKHIFVHEVADARALCEKDRVVLFRPFYIGSIQELLAILFGENVSVVISAGVNARSSSHGNVVRRQIENMGVEACVRNVRTIKGYVRRAM